MYATIYFCKASRGGINWPIWLKCDFCKYVHCNSSKMDVVGELISKKWTTLPNLLFPTLLGTAGLVGGEK